MTPRVRLFRIDRPDMTAPPSEDGLLPAWFIRKMSAEYGTGTAAEREAAAERAIAQGISIADYERLLARIYSIVDPPPPPYLDYPTS